MAFCNKHGIPHSDFLGWDQDDQDKALGFEREQAKVCPGCGTHSEVWEKDKFAYAPNSWQCPGCELLERERETIPEQARGVKVYLEPTWVQAKRFEQSGESDPRPTFTLDSNIPRGMPDPSTMKGLV